MVTYMQTVQPSRALGTVGWHRSGTELASCESTGESEFFIPCHLPFWEKFWYTLIFLPFYDTDLLCINLGH